ATRSRSSSWKARARPSRVARVSVSSMSAPAARASSKARMVFSAPSSARPRWAIRRGRGPGRNRDPGAAERSPGAFVDEGILFLLVLSSAPGADRTAGTVVSGAAGRDGPRCGVGAVCRLVLCGGPPGGLLVLGGLLEQLPGAVDQGGGEEQ